MRIDRVLPRLAFAVMILAAGVDMAAAASAVCASLQSRLNSLQRGASGGAGKAANLDNAIGRQQAEINAANGRARAAGCRGFQLFGSGPKADCAPIEKGLNRMQSNLQRLQVQRQSVGYNPAASSRQRSDLLQQLGQNDCGPQYAAYGNAARPRNFFERLFNPDANTYQPPQQQVARIEENVRPQARSDYSEQDRGFGRGNYRTLCVRTCDGYYFPISFTTSRSKFATDEQVCRQMCPGTDVALYAHRNPGQDSSQALSIDSEQPYSELPTAFSYRTTFHAGCTCGKSTALDSVAGGYDPATIGPFSAALAPVPTAIPLRGEDPETLANRAGDLDPDSVGKPNVAVPVAGLSPIPTGAARRVGPSYFYAQ